MKLVRKVRWVPRDRLARRVQPARKAILVLTDRKVRMVPRAPQGHQV